MRPRPKVNSYQITQTPPFRLTTSRFQNRKAVTSFSRHKHSKPTSTYFYIDFADSSLRAMQRIQRTIAVPPLAHEKAGKHHRIINVEDSSPLMQAIVKYEEGRHRTVSRQEEMKSKIKKSLDRAKKKLRTRSYVGLKSQMAEFYGETSSRLQRQASEGMAVTISPPTQKEQKQRSALKKMGLLHKWQ